MQNQKFFLKMMDGNLIYVTSSIESDATEFTGINLNSFGQEEETFKVVNIAKSDENLITKVIDKLKSHDYKDEGLCQEILDKATKIKSSTVVKKHTDKPHCQHRVENCNR